MNVDDFLARNASRFEDELKQLLRIPSVSADSRHAGDVRKACQFVADQLKGCGLAVEIIETEKHPIVYGEWLGAKGAPTLLIYGHYDVQPPDPLDLWITGPFEPTVRNGNLYARGATDDKGQMYTHVKALEAWMKTAGKFPINIKVIIEGEEEIGSQSIGKYLPANKEKLRCDYVVISDTCMFAPDQPAITYGLKGITYFEVFLKGANRDLHSGSFGGAVQNPCNVIADMMASLKDRDGRVLLPGFYDDVVEISAEERSAMKQLPFNESHFFGELDLTEGFGEKGYTTLERKWARPTCDVNGIGGGYQGEGAKTVLPCKAFAKVSFRLVPNQNPEKIAASFQRHLESIKPAGVTLEVKPHHGAEAVVVPLGSPGIKAAANALTIAYGRQPFYIREGGSIPIVTDFKRALGVDSLLLGYGLNDDNTHAPNEKFCLKDFHRGIRANFHLLEELAKLAG